MLALLIARTISADKISKVGLCTELLNGLPRELLHSGKTKTLSMQGQHLTLASDLIYNPSIESNSPDPNAPTMPVTILCAKEDKARLTVKGHARFEENGFQIEYTCHKNQAGNPVGDHIHFHAPIMAGVPAVCHLLVYAVPFGVTMTIDQRILSYDDKDKMLNVQLHGGKWPDFDVAVKFTAAEQIYQTALYLYNKDGAIFNAENVVKGTAEVGSKSVDFKCHAGAHINQDPFHIHFYDLSKEDVLSAQVKQMKDVSSGISYGSISLMLFLASAILISTAFGAAYLYRKTQKITPKAPAQDAPTAGEQV